MKAVLRKYKFKALACAGLLSLLACSPQKTKYVKEVRPPQPLSSKAEADAGKIYGDMCLINENAVTVVQSVYNTESDVNKTKEYSVEMPVVTETFLQVLEENINAPLIADPKAVSENESVTIYLFDINKNPENPDLHLLFSNGLTGTEKKDHPMAPSLIATINELCKIPLAKAQRAK
jgi:hypothetical protein